MFTARLIVTTVAIDRPAQFLNASMAELGHIPVTQLQLEAHVPARHGVASPYTINVTADYGAPSSSYWLCCRSILSTRERKETEASKRWQSHYS